MDRKVVESALERAIPDRAARQESKRDAPGAERLRVLVADDHPVNRTVAVSLLELQGYEVTAVSDGVDVLRALERQHFDIAFLDLSMPAMGGLETARIIREREQGTNRRLPLISVSGSQTAGNGDDTARLRRAEFDHHLRKPYSAADLHAAVERFTGARTRDQAGFDEAVQSAREAFRAEHADDLAHIDASIARRDSAALASVAHRLKGAAAFLSDPTPLELASKLEDVACGGDLAEAPVLRDALTAALKPYRKN